MKYGTAVVYEGAGGPAPLAFVASKEAGAKADIAAMDDNGAWGLHVDVPRNDDGGGHTWKPA